jgi:hypothetical protein
MLLWFTFGQILASNKEALAKLRFFENSGHLGWSLIPLYILERGIPKDYSG